VGQGESDAIVGGAGSSKWAQYSSPVCCWLQNVLLLESYLIFQVRHVVLNLISRLVPRYLGFLLLLDIGLDSMCFRDSEVGPLEPMATKRPPVGILPHFPGTTCCYKFN